MKKIVVAILATLYLGTSVSATIHLHYCMGKLIDWGLWHNDSPICGNCGMEKDHKTSDDGCCKDEYKYVKNSIDQKSTEYVIHILQVLASSTLPFYIDEASHFSKFTENYPVSHAPPINSGVEILIRNCIFRI